MIFALLLLQASAVEAEGPRWRDPPECWDGSQSELTHCAWTEYREADAEMNRQWKKTVAVLKRLEEDSPAVRTPTRGEAFAQPTRFAALLAAQRAWLTYRDEHCALSRANGGSIAPMHEGICLRGLTQKRAEELKQLRYEPSSGQPYFEDQ